MKRAFNNRLLIISTYFHPMPEIAAARLKSTVKYLIRLGWEVHIVTSTDPSYDYSADEGLNSASIYRAGGAECFPPVSGQKGIYSKLRSFLGKAGFLRKHLRSSANLFKYARWASRAYKLSKAAVRRYNIEQILVTIPRIEPLIVGGRLKKKMPWLKLTCEFRDLMSMNSIYRSVQAFYETMYVGVSERKFINRVDKFIFLTSKIKEIYVEAYRSNRRLPEGIVLTNGYDEEDYPEAPPEAEGAKFRISHVGHLYGTRDPLPFVGALTEFCRESKDRASSVEVCFVGKMDCSYREKLIELCGESYGSIVKLYGPVGHEEAVRWMSSSEVNLIITHHRGSEYAIPGKLFEYIGSGKPVLAVTSDDLLIKTIEEDGLGWTCENSARAIKQALLRIYSDWMAGSMKVVDRSHSKYGREAISKSLSGFLLEGSSEEQG